MKFFHDASIRTKLVINSLVITLIPLTIIGYVSNLYLRQEMIASVNKSLDGAASETVSNLDGFIQGNQDIVRTEAQLPDFGDFLDLSSEGRTAGSDSTNPEARIATILLAFSRRDQLFITSYALLDINGINVIDTDISNIGVDQSSQDYFREPVATGLPYVSSVDFSETAKLSSIYFCAPIRNRQGKIVGVLRMGYNATILQQIISNMSGLTGKDSYAVLLDKNHLRLADGSVPDLNYKTVVPLDRNRVVELQAVGRLPQWSTNQLATNLPAFQQDLTNATTEKFFTTQLHEPGTNPDMVAVESMKTEPWLIAFAQPQSVLLTPIDRQTFNLLLITLIATVLVTLTGIGGSKIVISPILQLTAQLQETLGGLSKSTVELRKANEQLQAEMIERKRSEEALHATEARYRLLVERIPAITYVVSTETPHQTVFISPQVERILGFTPDEWLADPDVWERRIYPEDRERVLTEGKASYEKKQPFISEYRIFRQDGQLIWLHDENYPIEEPGLPPILQGIEFDITDRKQAEETLRISEKRFQGAFEFAAIGMGLVATDGRWLRVNRALCELLGYSKEELLDKTFQDITHPDDLEADLAFLRELLEGKIQSYQMEKRYLHRSGQVVWVLINVSLVRDDHGEPLYFISQIENITDRKQAEEDLRTSETRYRELFEDSPISLWEEDFSAVKQQLDTLRKEGVTDFEEFFIAHPEMATECEALIKVLDVNNATIRLFGAKRKEDILKSMAEIFGGEPIQIFRKELVNIAAGKTKFDWEGINKTLDGRLIDIDLNWSVAPGYEESLSKVIVSMIDITERKQAENMLVAERDLLNTLINTLPDNIFIKDTMGHIVMNNIAHRRTLGVDTFEQAVGKTDFDFFPREQAAPYDADEKQIIRSGQPLIDKIEPLFDKENNQRWLQTTKVPLRDRHGNITGIVGFNHDITNRKVAEQKLAEERNLLRTLIDHLPDRIYAMDAKGRKTLSNLADWRASGGKTMEDVIGKTDFDIYPTELAKGYWALDKATIESGMPTINYEEQGLDTEGNEVSVLTTKVPLHDGQGNVVGLVGIGHDITERKLAEKRIYKQLERLAALRSIDQVIASSLDLRNSLTMILNQITRELGVDAADVLLLNSSNLYLEYSSGIGFNTKTVEKAKVRLGQDYAGRVALDRQLIQIPNLNDGPDNVLLKTNLAGEGFLAYFGVPLVAKGVVRGVLEVYHRSPLNPNQDWLDFLNTLANQAAIAIDNANLFDNLQRSNLDLSLAYDATIEGWSKAMDLRDKETEGHTQRVTEMTMQLAGLFGFKDEDLISVRRGALLHDIGKMGVPDAILLKPGALTEEEWVIMRKHPAFAFEMLSPINYLKSAIDIPYCHHEKWDGTGYPRGLKGDQIPLVARIFAIVDVWDAVTSDRPYRKAWSIEQAVEYLISESGKQFDPAVLKICLDADLFDYKSAI